MLHDLQKAERRSILPDQTTIKECIFLIGNISVVASLHDVRPLRLSLIQIIQDSNTD
jgi:hypothetical protein